MFCGNSSVLYETDLQRCTWKLTDIHPRKAEDHKLQQFKNMHEQQYNYSLICIQDTEWGYKGKIPCNSFKFFMRDVAIPIIVVILKYSLNHCIHMLFYCLWVRWRTWTGSPFRKKYRLCWRTLGLEKMQLNINTAEQWKTNVSSLILITLTMSGKE